ncbi:MAG: hypothetical protein JKY30_09435 [Flavobacteriales bacterium]|nr:hypothetical protein [Flavobacteriales bacterium]
MKNVFILILLLLSSLFTFSQGTSLIEISSTTITELTVCGQSENFQIKLKNDSSSALSGLSITVQLPSGIDYVQGSVAELSSYNIQEQSVGNNSALVFSANNLSAADSIVFTIATTANVSAIAYQQQGNLFRNDVSANFSSGQVSHTSSAYNVLYAALSILNVSPSSQTAITGDTVTRSITIVNAGNGRLSEFKLTDIRNNVGVDLVASDLGVLNATLDTITFLGADFAGIGNNDAYFNTNESITITQTLVASGCIANTVTSTIKTSWGCEGEIRESDNSYAHVTISLKNPI